MKPVPADSRQHTIIEEELRLLAHVSSVLSEIGTQVPGAPDFNAALLNLRDQISEAKPEDIGALVEQMMRISALAQSYGKGRDLPVNPRSPYFAHMRLEEDERTRDVLIGKRGFIDRGRKVQIVDWRNAPVSRIYYRYQEGDDYEEPIGGQILEGVIQARRSLTIEGGQLRRIGCPQGTFMVTTDGSWSEAEPTAIFQLSGGQGAAARPAALVRGHKQSRLGVHSGPVLRADKHLPEIAALIDPVQFELITRPESGLVVLQGGAGSGKTTVALHRVAYLNFNMPGRFRADKILVVVLSNAMVRYVERVLPSLGVKGVVVMTAHDWLQRTRRKVLPRAPRSYNDDTPAVVLRFKKHPLLLTLLREFVARQQDQLAQELRTALESTPEGELVLDRWNELAGEPPARRCIKLRSWLKQQSLSGLTLQQAMTSSRRMLRRLRDVVSDWAEALTDRALLSEATERLCPGAFSDRELESVCSWCSRQTDEAPDLPSRSRRRRDRRSRRRRDRRQDPQSLQDQLQDPYISLDGRDERELPVVGRLDAPDDSLLLYLFWLKHGALHPPGGKTIRFEHLVVDEAQDLSVLEVKVLLECTSKLHSASLAGDVAQRLVFDNAFSSWERLLEDLGIEATANTTLQLGYRSTEQIIRLARHVAGDAAAIEAWQATRSGASVELHRFGGQGEAVALVAEALRSLMAREPLASVAVIARYPEQARTFAAALRSAEVPGVRLVADQEFSFKPGIEVTDITQVKGLEFDYVILIDTTASTYPDTTESRNMLYIGATRAAHQLWIVSPGPPSPLLPEGLKNTER
jgi:DNA helicase-2/ATP-dependent DNA helicase PcrA